ncbi:MAG: germination protein YpeB [Betaproteobacteria bacterium]
MRKWQVTAGFLAVLAVAALWWGYSQWQRAGLLSNQLNATYNSSFMQLVSYVDGLEAGLAKGLVAGTPAQHVNQLTDVWRQANLAKESLARIPIQQGAFMRTSKFLTQTGDLAYVLARAKASGQPVGRKDLEKLARLRREAIVVGRELHRIQRAAIAGGFNWQTIRRGAATDLRQGTKQVADDEFQRLDRALADYPVMQYDGPFSDHVDRISPRGLTGPTVTQEEASRRALKVVPDPNRYRPRFKGMTRGKITAYAFDLVPTGSGLPRVAVDVSQKGGHIIWATNTRAPGVPRLSSQEAVRPAQEFLKRLGLSSMEASYAQVMGGVVTIPFVSVVNNVLVYPDMVKVAVALDRGDILSFDALQYLTNHRTRTKEDLTPKLTQQEARAKVNPDLRITATRLAVIPLEVPGQEALAWEFKAEKDGEVYYVYVNARTGREERILKIVNTPQGRLTM